MAKDGFGIGVNFRGRYRFNGSRTGNAFSDFLLGQPQDVADQFARMQLVLNPRNEGFPAAVNRGLQLATGRVLVVLNDDVIVTPHWYGVETPDGQRGWMPADQLGSLP